MKKTILLFALSFIFYQVANSQSISTQVYEIFQNKCMSCHSNATQQNGLDLEGAGANATLKALDVYNNLVGVTPSNSLAASKGYQYIYKGRPDKSFLFRKINKQLEPTIDLHADAGESMPPYGSEDLTDKERELIRQWILLGAPLDDASAEIPLGYVQAIPQMIENYYDANGLQSFPDGPPAAPDSSEGFQVKMGPFYLNPAGTNYSEMEFFQKYELDLPANVDVTRIDIKIATSSHHFILYDFDTPNSANFVKHGLREDPFHASIGLVAAVQQETDLRLPEGTAFVWEDNIVLDLNSHYINYSAANTYQAEVYFNVYTQPAGTAPQEMYTDLIANTDISIPNNGNEVTFQEAIISNNIPEIFLWGIMGHTHQWGTDYKTYLRNSNGTKGELIYDASCSANGAPGCVSPFFDYRHIPMLFFEPLRPVDMNPGMIHEASWVNNGSSPVWFGPTSEDEMMVLVLMYTIDTVGVVTSLERPENLQQETQVFPNPMSEEATVVMSPEMGDVHFILYNTMGQEVQRMENISDVSVNLKGKTFTFSKNDLTSGLYIYRVEDTAGRFSTGKIFIE